MDWRDFCGSFLEKKKIKSFVLFLFVLLWYIMSHFFFLYKCEWMEHFLKKHKCWILNSFKFNHGLESCMYNIKNYYLSCEIKKRNSIVFIHTFFLKTLWNGNDQLLQLLFFCVLFCWHFINFIFYQKKKIRRTEYNTSDLSMNLCSDKICKMKFWDKLFISFA